MKQLCLRFLVAVGVLMSTACATLREPQQPTGPHVTVMTYNVNHGMSAPERAVQAMLDSKADLICLQETTPPWERYLRGQLENQYPHMLFRHSRGAGGLAVLSRVPVEEVEYIPSKIGWFPALILNADTPIGREQIMNVHLHPKVNEQGSFTVNAYLYTGAVRMEEVQHFHSRLRPDVPTLIAGDFNEKDSSPALAWLEERGFINALREFDPYTRTWKWYTGVVTVTARLDHILYSKPLHSLSARVIEQGASDHYPVVAVFEKNEH